MLCRKGQQCQQGLGQKEVEVEMEEINQELGSSPPLPPPQEQDLLSSVGPLYLICYILLVLLLENNRDRHVKRSLRGQDLSAADPPLDARLLREPQMLQDLAQQSRHQQW